MQPSLMQTLSIPQIGSAKVQPSRLIQAGTKATRVMVRNTGGTLVLLAHDLQDLRQVGATAGVYQLPTGQSDVFVLSPGQSIFAAANGGGGQISIAVSEAVPVGTHYMES